MQNRAGNIVSIIHDPNIDYPIKYEPDNSLLGIRNSMLPYIKKLLLQAEFYDGYNLLKKYIKPGMKVFILCNFVYQRKKHEKELDFLGKCTNGSVIAAVAELCLQAVGEKGTITFGNAPLQSCNFDLVLENTGSNIILEQSKQKGLNISCKDLRSYVVKRTRLGNLVPIKTSHNDKIVEVDLGKYSLLNDIQNKGSGLAKFRVSDYNPIYTERYHDLNSHRYIISKDILDADVIINIPKMKTHEKVGVTLGTKGYVGAIASKECLAHHRFGPPSLGGDEYPDYNYFDLLGSKFHEFVFRQNYSKRLLSLLQILDRIYKRALRLAGRVENGAWFGNDTAWRMAIDIARICHYADKDGKLSREKQRDNLLIIDGIVGGEGNGPLAVRGIKSGVLLFSDNVALGDKVACRLMGYDYKKIPIVRESLKEMDFSVAPSKSDCHIILNGKFIGESDVNSALGRPFKPPKHWLNYLIT